MANTNQVLSGGRELSYVAQKDAYAGTLFQRIISAVNGGFASLGGSAVGKLSPPPPIDNINVQGTQAGSIFTCPSEILHHTLTHNQALQKGVRYFSEIDTSPEFLSPHVIDHGTSRSSFLTLPTNDSSSVKQTYYLRSYAQYPGSDPCKPTVFGNIGGAIGIQMTGTSNTSLLTSAGSGTASPTGQQGGKGLGVVLNRPAPGPKRSLA
jgi:hypothetical protein